jgi:hypothetical protein
MQKLLQSMECSILWVQEQCPEKLISTFSWKKNWLNSFKKKAAYLLNFGYQGMVSTIDALVNRNDVIVYDMDSHACIVDGVRLHSGKDLHTSTMIWKALRKIFREQLK